jgi:hypothetical protein
MDSRMVLMARKQPTAAKAPVSSASSSASELAMHLQNAAAYQHSKHEVIWKLAPHNHIFCRGNRKEAIEFTQHTKLWHNPSAYGAISSPNLSTIVSRVKTRSSFSTSLISLKNSAT